MVAILKQGARTMQTRITSSTTRGATVYTVWYQCPVSKIFQTYSSCATMNEARDDVRALQVAQ
jgi:hypothetical protein